LDLNLVTRLLGGILSLTWGNVVMMAIGGILIYLAIVKDYEPMLLLPIGAGTILANLPLTGMTAGIRELQLHDGGHPRVTVAPAAAGGVGSLRHPLSGWHP